MHFSPAALALSTTLALVSSASLAQSDHIVSPQSAALVADGLKAEKAGDIDGAFGLYVSALAYDPHNADAYVAMGDIARQQDLNGSAIRYYSRVLELDPNNQAALAGQGMAYVAKGAISRAEANLQQLELVCGDCDLADNLSDRIKAGPPERVVRAEDLESVATVEETPASSED